MNINKQILGLGLVVLLLAGCTTEDKPAKTYTVIDSVGNQFNNLTRLGDGWGWSSFRDQNGKRIVVRGNYSIIEE